MAISLLFVREESSFLWLCSEERFYIHSRDTLLLTTVSPTLRDSDFGSSRYDGTKAPLLMIFEGRKEFFRSRIEREEPSVFEAGERRI